MELLGIVLKHVHDFNSEIMLEPGRSYYSSSFLSNRARQEKSVATGVCELVLSKTTGRFWLFFQIRMNACTINVFNAFRLYSNYRFLYVQRVLGDYTPSFLVSLGCWAVNVFIQGHKNKVSRGSGFLETCDVCM